MRSIFALFEKPKAPQISATLNVQSVAERTPTSGLIPVEYSVTASPAGPLTMRVRTASASAPVFEKTLPEGSGEGRLLLHSHLLPNGRVELVFEVTANGRAVAERTLKIQVRNEGEVAEQVRASLTRRGAPVAFEGFCDSTAYDYADASLAAWFDREPAAVEAHIKSLVDAGKATAQDAESLRHFAEKGFVVLEDLVAPEHLKRLNAALDDAVARKVEGYEYGSSQRMHNLHQDYPAIRELWTHPKVMRMLELIFGVPANPCQSLTYVFGSQQQYHQDTIHLTPFPAGRMCGVWTALEDVQPDSGELVVFPGSHRLGRVYMKTADAPKVTDNDWTTFGDKVVPLWTDMITGNKLERYVYQPKAGTVLIWHENLMHAGQPRKDMSKSRRSIVGHYFAQGAVVYYDSSGQPGSVFEGAR